MKSFETEIKKYALKTRLKAIEREAIRDRVLSYMEYHPLPKHEKTEHVSFFSRGDFVYIPLNTLRVKISATLTAAVLIVGVPFIAERSVPGDVLYLVKTEVNEGIRTQLATTPYEKVTLETKLMERRIGEARLLASEGKLTLEVEAQIAETVLEHASAVQTGIAEIRVENEEEAALAGITFSSALEVQSAVLNESGKEENTSSVEGIISAVNTVREEVASDVDPASPSFDGLMGRIESETTRAYELFESVKESATAEEVSDIDRRFADIDRKIVGAKELRTLDETSAINDMINALGLTQKLIAFMTDIDIRETVTLETLVPVELTPEERLEAVQHSVTESEASRIAVEAGVSTIADAATREKVEIGLVDLALRIEAVRAFITEQNIEGAETSGVEARALAEDLRKLVAPTPDEVITLPEIITGNPLEITTPTTTETMVGTTTSSTTIIVDEFPKPLEVE